jgi:U2 small nuclear ribonucleoprotein A'
MNVPSCFFVCAYVHEGLGKQLPNLNALGLNNNDLAKLSDLLPLAELTSLDVLTLIGNPVTRVKNYRLYVIHLSPSLRFLDSKRVKPQVPTV